MTTPGTPAVVIVGGGPVGLLAGLCAHAAGLPFRLYERDREPRMHSRAIGIHPPSLRLIASLDAELAHHLVSQGTRIRRGHGMAGPDQPMGSLDFAALEPPFDYVLTLPQWRTERLLEEALRRRAPGAVRRGVEVPGPAADLGASFVLACDGRDSRMRAGAGIAVEGAAYPARYLMGDFPTEGWPDDPGQRDDAFLFLTPGGLVESFPVDPGVRRWVAEEGEAAHRGPGGVDASRAEGDGPLAEEGIRSGTEAARLAMLVGARCGVRLDPASARMTSAFQPEKRVATRFRAGNLVLCGDAAHVVSPIGGQGMNLGWLNAADAVATVARVLGGGEPARLFRGFERRAARRARRARRRGEQNMFLANRTRLSGLRARILNVVLRTPLHRTFARRFTMHGL